MDEFYMGTDFCKHKVPLVWYDILHVVDVLTQFPCLTLIAQRILCRYPLSERGNL
jgi:hypothetical protein